MRLIRSKRISIRVDRIDPQLPIAPNSRCHRCRPIVHRCLVKQPILAYGAGVPERLRQSFVASGFNIQKLLAEIATLSSRHGLEAVAAPRKSAAISRTETAALSRDAATGKER